MKTKHPPTLVSSIYLYPDESDQRMKALTSQYETQLTRLRADLESARTAQTDAQSAQQERDAANKRCNELTQRVS